MTALPCGLDRQGTPFGVQLVGPMYHDRRLLSIAAALEAVFDADVATKRPVPDLDALVDAGAGRRDTQRRSGPASCRE